MALVKILNLKIKYPLEEETMKKSLVIFIIFLAAAMLNGCILTHTPKEDPVIMSTGVAQTFTVSVFPAPKNFVWYVDDVVDPAATGKTYSYILNNVLPSTHTIKVVANHFLLPADVQTWNIQHEGSNRPPVASAGPDQKAHVKRTVTLNGSGSTDPDGNIVSYLWEQTGGPNVMLSNPGAIQPQFLAEVPASSSLTFKLTVTDVGGLSSNDTCIVSFYEETWGMFMQDSKHTGRSPYIGAQTNNVKWSFMTTGKYVYSSPTIGANGMVYVGEWGDQGVGYTFPSKVYALDGDTGAEIWSFLTQNWIWGAPAIGTDGTVYVASDDTILYALDGMTGDLKWSFAAGDSIWGSPTIGADGTVYFGSWDGYIYALDGATGDPKWSYDTLSLVICTPAIGADGTVYVGDMSGNVIAIDGETGEDKWVYVMGLPGSDQVYGSPSIGADGTVYIGGWNSGKLFALDGATGVKKWEYNTGSGIWTCPAIGADGTVYVGSYYNGKLTALDGATGAFKWAFAAAGRYMVSSPAIGADGTVYVGDMINPPGTPSKVYALDGATGAVKWDYLVGDRVESSPAIGAVGTVYIGSKDGNVDAFGD